MLKPSKCKQCGSLYHSAMWHKPRKPIARIKRPRKLGKRGLANREANAIWLENNPPDVFGYWDCYLRIDPSCLRRVSIMDLNIEHGYSKVRRPDLRDNQTNLQPACHPCNKRKGSKTIDDLVADYPHLEQYVL